MVYSYYRRLFRQKINNKSKVMNTGDEPPTTVSTLQPTHSVLLSSSKLGLWWNGRLMGALTGIVTQQ